MTQKNFDFERDLTDAFAPVKMPLELQQRLLQLPQLYPQRRASWLGRFLPSSWLDGLMLVSARPVLGMTTGAAAACCSLVIGLSLGLNGALPQTQVLPGSLAQNSTVASSTTSTAVSENDSVALVYAAADMPGELP